MKFNNLFILSFLLLTSVTQAEKIAAGVYKSDAGGELLTTIEKPCDPVSGNATLITAGKHVMGCWVAEGDKIKVTWLDGSTSKMFESSNMVPLGDIPVAPKPAPTPETAQSKSKKTHLTCEADGWTMEVDVERNAIGDLQRFVVGGDLVTANEKSMFITFSYDGLSFSINTVNAGFSYEPAGVQNFIRKNLTGGKSKGTGTCRINELVKKF
jgi:hypothetical protein